MQTTAALQTIWQKFPRYLEGRLRFFLWNYKLCIYFFHAFPRNF